jgi:glutamine synthetase
MSHYGSNNRQRMTGSCETASYDVFSHGYGDRTASIRIPNSVFLESKGYLEDRRPGSNMDPYVVSKLLVESVI